MQLSKNKVCLLPTGFSLHKARGTWRLQPVEWHLLKRQLLTHILFAQLKRVCLCASKVDNVCVCVCDVNRLVNCVGINSANWLARRRCSDSSLIATQSSPLIYASCLTSKWAKKKEGEASSVRWWQARKTSKSGKRAAKGNSGKHSKCTPWSTLIVLRDAMP